MDADMDADMDTDFSSDMLLGILPPVQCWPAGIFGYIEQKVCLRYFFHLIFYNFSPFERLKVSI